MKEAKYKCAAFDHFGAEGRIITSDSILGKEFEDMLKTRSSNMSWHSEMESGRKIKGCLSTPTQDKLSLPL